MLLGWILIVIGVLFFFKEVGWIEGDFWGYLLSILFILIGIAMVSKRRKGGLFAQRRDRDHKVVDEQ